MTKTKVSKKAKASLQPDDSNAEIEAKIESKLDEKVIDRPKGKRPPQKPLKINGVSVVEIASKVEDEIIHPSTPYVSLTSSQISEIKKNLIKYPDRVQLSDSDAVDEKIDSNSQSKPNNESKNNSNKNQQNLKKRNEAKPENNTTDIAIIPNEIDEFKSEQSINSITEIAGTPDKAPARQETAKNKNKNKKKNKSRSKEIQEADNTEVAKIESDIKEEQADPKAKDANLIKRDAQKNLPKQSATKPNKNKTSDTKPQKVRPALPKRTEILYSSLPIAKQPTKLQAADSYLNNFLDKVEDYLRKEAFIEPGGKLLLAVSGGVDSIVLMDSLAILAQKMRFTLYIAHYNHKLRGFSSDRDEVLVRNTSKEYGLNFYSSSGNVKQYSTKNSLSIEQAARLLRYNFFERTARNVGVDIVATAHTEDDLVETFFINLLRGSGLTGLSSMPSKRKFVKNVTLVRPFLQFSKKDLYEYAGIRKLKWFEDETNSLLNYTRNKVRHDLIPKLINEYNPSVIDVISRTTELIQGADEVIKDIVVKSITNVIDEANNERFSLKINMLLTFNKFMQGELIQYSWNKYFRLQPLPLSAIDRILELNNSQTGSICEISSGYFVLRDRNNLMFAKKVKDISTSLMIEKPGEYKIGKYKLVVSEVKPEEVVFSDDKSVEYIPAKFMEPFAEIRNKREGDVFYPLGSPGEMKLSDFLTNEKVALVDKPNILVLTNKMHILWVLGHRISEKCRLDMSEQRIYKLKLINSDKK